MPTTWNPADQVNVSLAGGNLVATLSGANGGVRTVASQNSGKWYWETTVNSFGGSGSTGVGLGNASAALLTVGNSPFNACLCYLSGTIYINNVGAGVVGGSVANGVVICHAVDLGGLLYWARIGPNLNWNNNVANNPATGVGGLNIASIASAGVPTFGMAGLYGTSPQITANFGAGAFNGVPPAGYTAGFGPAAAAGAQARAMVLA